MAYAASREACRVIPISRKMEKQAKIPSGEGADVYPSSSIYQSLSLYFPFFPGIQARRRRGFVFTSVEATLKTDSMSLRRRDGIRVGRQRNAIPSGIRRAYTSSRKRRKYCVATNKNMYRVFREEFFFFLLSLPSGTRHFLLHSG